MIYFDSKNNLVNISNSILKHFNKATYNESSSQLDEILKAKEYKKVAVILFDGMGKSIEEKHLKYNSFLLKNKTLEITSVFPPTTVAATTAFLNGRYPNQTCWLGWKQYFKEHDEVIDMFSGVVSKSNPKRKIEPNPSYQRFSFPTLLDLIKSDSVNTYHVTHHYLGGKSKNLRGFFDDLDEAMKQSGSHFIYGYYNTPDHQIHVNGVKHSCVKRIVKRIDRSTKILANNNKDNLIIVLADHSLVDNKPVFLDLYQDISDMIYTRAIDFRCCSIYLKDKNNKEEFKKKFNKYFSKDFKLYEIEEVLELKLFGLGANHPDFLEFLGDFVCVSHSNKYFDSSASSFYFKGAHSGGMKEESLINVAILNR